MLSLHQLEIFHVVAQSHTFQEAADKLYISQPAVSQHIKALEVMLGTKLFERSRRGITLTEAGRVLLKYTSDILRLVAEAENSVTNVHNLREGQTRIGATPNISNYLLPEWIRQFREEYPNLTPSITTNVTAAVMDCVLNNRVDMGFIEGELNDDVPREVNHLVLEAVPQVVVIGPQHEWWDAEAVSLRDLDQKRMVMRQRHSQTRIWLETLLAEQAISPRIIGEFDNPEAIKHAVRSGTCLTIMPEYAISREVESDQLRMLRLRDLDLQRDLKLIWNNQVIFSPVTRAFLKKLIPQFPSLQTILA